MTLHTTTVSNADKMFGVSTKTDSGKVRLRAGDQWLHWSGEFLTGDRKHAWTGSVDQARACRRTFDAAAGCKMVGA